MLQRRKKLALRRARGMECTNIHSLRRKIKRQQFLRKGAVRCFLPDSSPTEKETLLPHTNMIYFN